MHRIALSMPVNTAAAPKACFLSEVDVADKLLTQCLPCHSEPLQSECSCVLRHYGCVNCLSTAVLMDAAGFDRLTLH